MDINFDEYLDKFCAKHECTKEEALKTVVVQEYIKDKEERAKGVKNELS